MKYLYPNFGTPPCLYSGGSYEKKGQVVVMDDHGYEQIDSFVPGCGVAVLTESAYCGIENSTTEVTKVLVHDFHDPVDEFYDDGENVCIIVGGNRYETSKNGAPVLFYNIVESTDE